MGIENAADGIERTEMMLTVAPSAPSDLWLVMCDEEDWMRYGLGLIYNLLYTKDAPGQILNAFICPPGDKLSVDCKT
jgi:hypothetical protein